GIGTLIVFIAMVLVAAVAASVIIQTSETLQNRAYAVGKETIKDVSSGLKVISVSGKANSDKTIIESLAIAIKPRAGSVDIDLNETIIYMQNDNLTALRLDTGEVSDNVSANGVFNTLNMDNLGATEFGIIATHDRDSSIVNNFGMSTDDQAMLIINLTAALPANGGLLPGGDINGNIVPEFGSSGIFIIMTPSAFTTRIVEL
ncbi:MAG: hypothetical protein KAR55_04480, partial [Thermoplasmatales archaeon]|nr:hypothetical protein [Thermoplasmatales archaeon]